MSDQSLQLWRRKLQAYDELVEQVVVGVLRSERRDISAYLTKLMSQKPFRKFCYELYPKLYDTLTRFVGGEACAILEHELFGNSLVLSQTTIDSASALASFSKFYAAYLSACVLGDDPFNVDVDNYRDSIKAAVTLTSATRYIDRPALHEALNSVEQDSALIYRTKFKQLNFVLGGGLRSRRLYTIGGAPGVGKSGLLLNHFMDACLNGVDSVYISLENSFEETQRRILAYLAEYDLSQLYFDRPGVRETVLERLEARKEAIHNINTHGTIIETSSMTVDEIRGVLQEKKPQVLVLDYLNLVSHVVFRDKANDLEDLTITLARIAKEYHIAVITACQLNRGAIQAKEPDESNVGDSFGIVKASDIFFTLFPFRPADSNDSSAAVDDFKELQMVLKIAKSRFTALGRFPLIARKNIVSFNEL